MTPGFSRRRLCFSTVALPLAALTRTAVAAGYPARPVRIITQGAAGSGPDVIARLVADRLSRLWQQPVAIFNHPGAGGVTAARAAAAAEPDGFTLYIPTITTFVIMPELQPDLPIDMNRDFVHIGLVAETPMMFATSPAIAAGSLSDFVALTRERPGGVFYAANNHGYLHHMKGELLRKQTVEILTFVPYPGALAGLQDLAGGRIGMIVESVGALTGAIRGGTLKPLAVASARRLQSLPDVPTASETIPGFEAMGWFVLSAPAKTPADIVQRVNHDLNRVLAEPDLLGKLQDLGAFPRPLSPAETQAFIAKEDRQWRPKVRELGLAQPGLAPTR
jgi:tripartite-type tricarboxylate transporter receptor subunit TctC